MQGRNTHLTSPSQAGENCRLNQREGGKNMTLKQYLQKVEEFRNSLTGNQLETLSEIEEYRAIIMSFEKK